MREESLQIHCLEIHNPWAGYDRLKSKISSSNAIIILLCESDSWQTFYAHKLDLPKGIAFCRELPTYTTQAKLFKTFQSSPSTVFNCFSNCQKNAHSDQTGVSLIEVLRLGTRQNIGVCVLHA